MKKYIAFLFAVLLLLSGCQMQTSLGAPKGYPVQGDIRSLEVDIGSANVVIQLSDSFAVESNLKNLTVTEKNGVLTVRQGKQVGVAYTDGMLTVYIPEDVSFDSVDITTGAGGLSAEALRTRRLDLVLGAGQVDIGFLEVTEEADMEGGAGAVSIADGHIKNFDLEMGVGALDMTAALLGDCDLSFGVGESRLTLLGDKADYRIEIEKGLGAFRVDGEAVSDYAFIGSGPNSIEIEGGVGGISLMFR